MASTAAERLDDLVGALRRFSEILGDVEKVRARLGGDIAAHNRVVVDRARVATDDDYERKDRISADLRRLAALVREVEQRRVALARSWDDVAGEIPF